MSNETKHTPTPWAIEVSERACFHEGNRVSIYRISQDGGETVVETVAEVWPTPGTDADVGDGRRIVAAVNAVEGIPTEALEDGVVSELLEAATAISKGIAEKGTLPAWDERFENLHAAIARAEDLPAFFWES